MYSVFCKFHLQMEEAISRPVLITNRINVRLSHIKMSL